jgi:ADP-heptose:LPS heptosyltransferase
MTTFAACLNLVKRVARKAARTPAWAAVSIAKLYRRAIHQLVFVLTEQYWLIDYVPNKSIGSESVLLVRLDLIGDFVIWLDAAKEFKNLYPNKRIVLYANSIWAPLAEKLSYWDQVIAVDVSRLREDDLYRLGFLIRTHWYGFGIAIQPTYSREYVGDLLIRATRAAQRIAHFGDINNISLSNKLKSDPWYTKLIPKVAGTLVEFTSNAELIRALGNSNFKSKVPSLSVLTALPAALKIVTPYCVLVPGASWAPKTWPIENFVRLAKKMQLQFGLKVVVCGAPNEKAITRRLALSCGGDVLDLAGKTKLIELIEVIRHATLVVSNDSSAIHIAAATGTRAVCVLGGGHYGRFLPYFLESQSAHRRLPVVLNEQMDCYGCLWRCKYVTEATQVVPCVANVSIERVVNVCVDMLSESQS